MPQDERLFCTFEDPHSSAFENAFERMLKEDAVERLENNIERLLENFTPVEDRFTLLPSQPAKKHRPRRFHLPGRRTVKAVPLTKADLEKQCVRKDLKIESLYADIEQVAASRNKWREKYDKSQSYVISQKETICAYATENERLRSALDQERDRADRYADEANGFRDNLETCLRAIDSSEEVINELRARLAACRVSGDETVPFPPTIHQMGEALGVDERLIAEAERRAAQGTQPQPVTHGTITSETFNEAEKLFGDFIDAGSTTTLDELFDDIRKAAEPRDRREWTVTVHPDDAPRVAKWFADMDRRRR